jgi:hypothetical protein
MTKTTTAALNPLHGNKVACPNSSKRNLREMHLPSGFDIVVFCEFCVDDSTAASQALARSHSMAQISAISSHCEEPGKNHFVENARESEIEGEEGRTKTFVKSRALSRKHSSEWMMIANVWAHFLDDIIHKLIYTLVCLSPVCFYILFNQQGSFFPLPKFSQLIKNVFKMAKSPIYSGFF